MWTKIEVSGVPSWAISEELKYCKTELTAHPDYVRVLCGAEQSPSCENCYTQNWGYFDLDPEKITPPLPLKCTGENFGGNGSNTKLLIVNDQNSEETLSGFGFIKSAGVIYPKGLVSAEFGNEAGNMFYDFSPTNTRQHKTFSPNIKYYCDDWDTEQLIYVESILDTKVNHIVYEGEPLEWTLEVSSSNFLEISHISLADGEIFIRRVLYW